MMEYEGETHFAIVGGVVFSACNPGECDAVQPAMGT
jgi:hypothetical protein